ncbi:hypothetical protein JCM19239_3822 [Vibrio variabilis]|uniref:ABC transporter domain-containing protein n=2 Tax=Vibrionaceae TaxID=641 RepID=A0ABQ0J9V3_9VIBR|nr:hypothetical protein JCM19239_3822 [Vibrio variabilis]
MSLNDDKTSLEKSPPIRKFYGEVVGSGITHRYQGAQTGLTNLGFKLAPGSKTAISGPAGSGKTTLLMVIAGLEERYQGAVYIDGYNIKQFNNFRYRKAINFIPFDMHLFEGSIRSNYVLHNGVVSTDQMLYTFKLLELHKWFPDGLDSNLNTEVLKNMPSGVIQRLRIAIGLGDMSQNLFIIDEPFVGVENEHASYLNRLFSGALKDKTVVYTTMDPALITSSTHCLLLEPDGNQKYFGLPDKVMATMG